MEKKGNSAYGKGVNNRSSFKKEGSKKFDGSKKPFAKEEKKFPERKKFDGNQKETQDGKPFGGKSKNNFGDFKIDKKNHGGDKFADRKKLGAAQKSHTTKYSDKSFTKQDDTPKRNQRASDTDVKRSFKKPFDKKTYQPKVEKEKPRYKADEQGGKPYGERAMEKIAPIKFAPNKNREDKKERTKKPQKFADKAFAPVKKDRKSRIDPAALQPQTFDDKVYGELADDEPKKAFRPGRTTKVTNTSTNSKQQEEVEVTTAMTLNKYIAHSGECSRRDAAAFVKEGKVRVNGELIVDPGYRISPGDQITLSGKKLTPQKGLVYILLNKPKGFITTTEDERDRKTVMDLVENSGVDRLFPVGRLDRNTTGLLLMTNDGALAHKLSHPSYNIRKVYQVTLDKNLTNADYQKIVKGLELEDGKITVDEIAYLEHRNEVGIEIHSGKNRIVRRIFESLGYEVDKLDRVMYAGLTKKNLPRSKWRFLNEKEVILLKHFKN